MASPGIPSQRPDKPSRLAPPVPRTYDVPVHWFLWSCLGGLVGLIVLGCSADVESSQSPEDASVIQAAIVVERRVDVRPAGPATGQALVGFLSVPTHVDPGVAMQLVGLEPSWPDIPGCKVLGAKTGATVSSMGTMEFLDAGSVEILAAGSQEELAPRVFPTVTDSIAGLMYTSREPTKSLWPAAAQYVVRTTGGPGLPPLNVTAQAPAELDSVTVGGAPLAAATSIHLDAPVDLTWSVGQPGDVVWVELASLDTFAGVLCAFGDDSGVGTIPSLKGVAPGAGTLEVHRSRSVPFRASEQARGAVRFDFSVMRNVELL